MKRWAVVNCGCYFYQLAATGIVFTVKREGWFPNNAFFFAWQFLGSMGWDVWHSRGKVGMRFWPRQPENDVGHIAAHVKVMLHLPVEINNTHRSHECLTLLLAPICGVTDKVRTSVPCESYVELESSNKPQWICYIMQNLQSHIF